MSIEYSKEVSEVLKKCSQCSSSELEKQIKNLRKLALTLIEENKKLRRKISLSEVD